MSDEDSWMTAPSAPSAPSAPLAPSVVDCERSLFEAGCMSAASDSVISEVPIALSFNSISYAVMMATPSDLEDFIFGFAVGEGIVGAPSAIYDVAITPATGGFDVNATVSNAVAHRLKGRRRSMAGPTGCGICGIESIDQLRQIITPVASRPAPTQLALDNAIEQFRPRQQMSQISSGAHAAAWCAPDGNIHALREDVGRHNALDKLLGWYCRNPCEGFVLVSSRASYEMVAKSAAAGISTLVAMSAPTSLAIETAKQARLKLIAFASQGRHSRYS